jgi:hypothetical protein
VRPESVAGLYGALSGSALHHRGAIGRTNGWTDVESLGLNLSRSPSRGGRFSGVDRWPVFKCPPRITINANRELAIHEQEKLLRIIDGKLNRLFLGPRYAKRAVRDRVGFVAVPEYKVGSVHFHGAIRIPNQVRSSVRDKDPKVVVENLLWDLLNEKNRDDKRLLPGACIDVQPYLDGWIKYILKNTRRDTVFYINGLPNIPEVRTSADDTERPGTSDVPWDVLNKGGLVSSLASEA